MAAALAVGNVNTVPYDEGASATITPSLTRVDDNSYILNLSIPYGPTGETGATGETGPAITLSIGTVDAVPYESGATADVVPGTGDNEYQLNLSVPYGPTGPTAGLAAYGGLYSTSGTVNPTAGDTATQIPLTIAMPLLNVTNASNELTVSQAGVYEITYSVSLTPTTAGGDIDVYVRSNDTELTESATTIDITTNETGIFNNSVIVNLTAEAQIDLALESADADAITINYANLTVKKLDTGAEVS